MATFKGFLLVFAILLAAAFLVSTAEETQAKDEPTADLQDYYRGGGGGYPGRGRGGYPGRGGGGYYPYPGRGGGRGYPGRGGGGYCRWGCCARGYYGGCRCCSRADEVPEAMYRAEAAEVHP